MKKRKVKDVKYYPQYCFDCKCSYISKERHSKCWNCKSENTINCYEEKYKENRENGIAN